MERWITSRMASCFSLRLLRLRVRGFSGPVASLMVLLLSAPRGHRSSNVGGPWWGVGIETVSGSDATRGQARRVSLSRDSRFQRRLTVYKIEDKFGREIRIRPSRPRGGCES